MDLQLENRPVLITGGSKGIGLACAWAFLEEGARVLPIARNGDVLNLAAQALLATFPTAKVHVIAADSKDAVAAAAARRTPPGELTPQHWRDGMDAKYFTYVNVVDPVTKLMASRGKGVILNVVGMGGKIATTTHLAGATGRNRRRRRVPVLAMRQQTTQHLA